MDWWTTIRSCWSGELLSARLICVNKVCSSCSVFTGDRPWSLYVRPWAFFSKHTTYQVFVCLKLRANRRNNSQHCWPTMLGVVASVFTQLKVWPVSNFAQQLPTTRNNMQQGVQRTQHVTSNNVGSCWPTLLLPFARGFRKDLTEIIVILIIIIIIIILILTMIRMILYVYSAISSDAQWRFTRNV